MMIPRFLKDVRPEVLARFFEREEATSGELGEEVRGILEDVRSRGDRALFEQRRAWDRVEGESLLVPREACTQAWDSLDSMLRDDLTFAFDNIEAFHQAQRPRGFEHNVLPGVRVGRRPTALARAGIYAPGGRASYPSSVLMGVIPAKVAGVEDVIVCSPPSPDNDGLPPTMVLAACALTGVDRVFAIGGAGAVGAMAYGTQSVPRVDVLVGPGSARVDEAKRQVSVEIPIDLPAGPSEILIVADETADAEAVAVELLAQAEHDPSARAVLVSTDEALAQGVRRTLEGKVPSEPRSSIIRQSLEDHGAILVVESLEEAVAFAERFAPEHLALYVREPRALLPRIRRAGSIFLGSNSSVAFGDYTSGTNHVLPTGGSASRYSGLSVETFLRWTSYQEMDALGASLLAGPTQRLAMAEGLQAHAAAAALRGSESKESTTFGPEARESYRGWGAYDPGRVPCPIDLSDNTNQFGTPPAATKTYQEMKGEVLARYPTPNATSLIDALAESYDIAPQQIATGCGSDDLLDSIVRAYGEPGDLLLSPSPTFSMVASLAKMNGLRYRGTPYLENGRLDVQSMAKARPRLLYVARPDNPLGTQAPLEDLEAIMDRTGALLILDEAYAEFAEESLFRWALSKRRVVVTRTFSKAWGLAGLRVGYALGDARLIEEVRKSRGPYKVGPVSERVAVSALRDDREWMLGVVKRSREARDYLSSRLRDLGLSPLDSCANFVLVPVGEANLSLDAVCDRLTERGLAVRAFRGLQGVGDAIRVTVAPRESLDALVDALRDPLASGRDR